MTIKDLPLLAKTVIDGFMNGFNKSTVKGPGLEFSQYRSYQPGDDLRWLDWRMFARSDRYYIRESEVETSISVRFLVDASASMNHDDDGIKKIDYARFLAASLAYLANLQGDSVALNVFKDGELFSLPSKPDPQHLQRLFYHLQGVSPAGTFTSPVHYKELFAGNGRKELLVFITDMYQADGEINALLTSLAALKHEIIVFHLMGQNELDFDFKGYSTLEDLETGETIQVNAQRAKETYTERLQQHIAEIRSALLGKRIAYRMLSTAQPLDEALRDFFGTKEEGGVMMGALRNEFYKGFIQRFVDCPPGDLTHPATAIAGPPSLLRIEGLKSEAHPLFRRKRGSGSDSEPGVSKISHSVKTPARFFGTKEEGDVMRMIVNGLKKVLSFGEDLGEAS